MKKFLEMFKSDKQRTIDHLIARNAHLEDTVLRLRKSCENLWQAYNDTLARVPKTAKEIDEIKRRIDDAITSPKN